MTMQIRRIRSATFLSLILMLFFTTACGGATELPPDGGEDPTDIVAEPAEGLPEALGVVLDPDGLPLPFVSLLVHGFVDEDPVITLQEMLLSWEVGSDVIQDSRDFKNPEPDTSNFPAAGGYVTWNLIHEVKLLPIDIKR